MSREAKDRLPLRMQPETKRKIEQWYAADNCRSMNEFVEKAVNFYADYLAVGENHLLPNAILSAINGRLDLLEQRLSSLTFKQAVEMDMIAGILSDVYRLDEEDLRRRRAQSVRDVKRTNGRISLEQRARQAEDDALWQG